MCVCVFGHGAHGRPCVCSGSWTRNIVCDKGPRVGDRDGTVNYCGGDKVHNHKETMSGFTRG